MTSITPGDLDALLGYEGECVSLLLPTHRAGREVQQGKIRLKNLLREAESLLTGGGRRREEAQALLAPGVALLDDEASWRSLEDGLALFLAPGLSRRFTVPAPLAETVVVGRRFFVLPLLPLLADRSFLVLALSAKSVRLFEADRHRAVELDLPGVPRSLTDAVGTELEAASIQVRSVMAGAGGSIFHGQGAGQGEEGKEEATRFCLRVDAGLRALYPAERRPLVLAAAEPLASIYRQVGHFADVVPEVVAGNPDLLSGEDLRRLALGRIEPLLGNDLDLDVSRCRELLGTGRASTDVREIVPAALDGRVEALMVSDGARVWGDFDATSREVEIAVDRGPGDEELLNLAATATARAGGRVRIGPRATIPSEADLAAVFRY